MNMERFENKTKIEALQLVGFRVFPYHKLLKKSNLLRFRTRLARFKQQLAMGVITRKHVCLSIVGWEGYAKMANTYRLREDVQQEIFGGLG